MRLYRVPTSRIRSGMQLARTITLANERDYLVAGAFLRESYISLLLKHGITSVYVVNESAPDVIPEDVVAPETRTALTDQLRTVVKELARPFELARDRTMRRFSVGVDTAGLRRCVDQVVHELMANPTAVYNLADIRTADDATLCHSVNVCILSTLLGAEMGLSNDDLKDLALGALMHDIGKVTTPKEILNKPGPLTPEEFEIMACHPTEGWEILRNQREISVRAAIVALQHHERWQGGGYPSSLSGKEIYRFSLICAIADAFDAMTADRVYRPGLSSAKALDNLTNKMTGHFEPTLLWNFTQCVAPYPVGSLVEITGGTQAVVVKTTRKQTYRPRIRLIRRADGSLLPDQPELDLLERPEVEIVRLITEYGDSLEGFDDWDCRRQGESEPGEPNRRLRGL